jgi:hypothetical protein
MKLQNMAEFSIINAMFLTKLNEVLASKNNWKSFVSDRLNFFSLSIALLLNIIQWALIYFKLRPDSSNILLHYNVVYGTDLVDRGTLAYLIPGLALIFLLVNFTVGYFMYNREKLASYFLNIASVPVQIIFLVAVVVLILAND